MAKGSLNLKVSKGDFENRIQIIEIRMAVLEDVIGRYGRAKENLDQFIENGDSNYEAMCQRIDANVTAAKKAHAALNETKLELQATVDKMEGMSDKVKSTISAGVEATLETVEMAIKIDSVL